MMSRVISDVAHDTRVDAYLATLHAKRAFRPTYFIVLQWLLKLEKKRPSRISALVDIQVNSSDQLPHCLLKVFDMSYYTGKGICKCSGLSNVC